VIIAVKIFGGTPTTPTQRVQVGMTIPRRHWLSLQKGLVDTIYLRDARLRLKFL
jgi:hypothetical protein